MQYCTLSTLVKPQAGENGSESVAIPQDLLRRLLIAAVKQKGEYDEDFYKAVNSDISDAVAAGRLPNGAEHYYNSGYFENRQPKKFLVDERYYLEQNPDVVSAIRNGVIASAQEHFEFAGFREGRSPYGGFSLI